VRDVRIRCLQSTRMLYGAANYPDDVDTRATCISGFHNRALLRPSRAASQARPRNCIDLDRSASFGKVRVFRSLLDSSFMSVWLPFVHSRRLSVYPRPTLFFQLFLPLLPSQIRKSRRRRLSYPRCPSYLSQAFSKLPSVS